MQHTGVRRVWTMQRCSVLLCIALQQRNHPLSRSALFFHIKNTYKLQRGYVIINTWIISGVAARKCLLKQTATSWSVIINDTWIISGVAARKCLLKQTATSWSVIINDTWIISGVAARKCLLKQTAASWSVIINDTWIISGVAARKCLLKQMDRADRPGRLLQYALGSF